MKQYQSTTEGVWVELKSVNLTKEQRALLMSTNESDTEAKKSLMEEIKSQREVAVEAEKATELTALYNSKKPELKPEDVYQLISADVSESLSGIINYRVTGEHKQIRF